MAHFKEKYFHINIITGIRWLGRVEVEPLQTPPGLTTYHSTQRHLKIHLTVYFLLLVVFDLD